MELNLFVYVLEEMDIYVTAVIQWKFTQSDIPTIKKAFHRKRKNEDLMTHSSFIRLFSK